MSSDCDKLRLGRLLRDANLVWRERTYSLMASKGFPEIRPAHSPLLRYLPAEGARTADLAAMAKITKQSMGYLVKSLEETGYVELVQDPSDGRAQLVRFTAKGVEADKALASISATLEREFAKSIGRENLEAMKRLLAGLVAPPD